MLNRHDIRRGIELELDSSTEFLDYVIRRVSLEGNVWAVEVDLNRSTRGGLDESLEGSAAWWAGPPKGAADVLSVLPESEQINLRFATAPPPGPDELIRLYPPRYLEALRDVWSDVAWANRCIDWLERRWRENGFNDEFVVATDPYPWLRERQAKAFELPGWEVGFLWGPPGTGKTTTLGALLAQYLIQFPGAKVLLLSTTNTAIDQALIAVDRALEQLASPAARQTRQACKRIGSHFHARYYEGREHLLPTSNTELVKELAALEAKMPEREDVRAYAAWKEAVEAVRQKMRKQAKEVLRTARLAAKWLGRSMFAYRNRFGDSVVRLNEQSRMAEPICRVVSDLFYRGDLQVARDKIDDPLWLRERRLPSPPAFGSEAMTVEMIEAEGIWSRKYRGPIRHESATLIADWTEELIEDLDPDELIILTPFRAQRTLIRGMLRRRRIRGVLVSTVHRAQGSERHTVIFDPVQGTNDFLRTEDAKRLVNVAISRAKARLILTLSPGDRENPLFDQIARVVEMAHLRADVEPISVYVHQPEFPHCCAGKIVKIGRVIGQVTSILENGLKFELVDLNTGETRRFATAAVIERFG